MGLKTLDVYNGGKDWFINTPIIKNIFSNPINTAIIIVMIMVLLVAYYYRDYDGDDRYGKLFRVGLYSGIFILIAMFLHDAIITKELNKKIVSDDENIIFRGSLHPDEKLADIKPTSGRGERRINLEDIPDIQLSTRSADDSESDIMATRQVKLEDLV